ncbi:MAG: fis 1 [Gammaproteobacteria bacterium]|jgi:Fis family transcriptional regulator|nr:fis 1 [Gammaproteobacteria bacterium]
MSIAEAIEKKNQTKLQGPPNQPLRDCVLNALRNYFTQLDGELPRDLYNLVLNEIEAPLLEVVMDYTKGNQSKAAVLLGLSRGTLRKKLHLYSLE